MYEYCTTYAKQMATINEKIKLAKKIAKTYARLIDQSTQVAETSQCKVSKKDIWKKMERIFSLNESSMRRMLAQAEIEI